MTVVSSSDNEEVTRQLSARLDAMLSGQLQVPVTPGPVFALLAMAVAHSGMIRPELSDCKVAAQALQQAEPNGYVISRRTRSALSSRTFASELPDPPDPSYAYVHVSDRGMIELVAGEVADPTHGLVSLGGIEQSMSHGDAHAVRAAFDALGVGGRIVVVLALLYTQGARVKSRETIPELSGVLDAPIVKIAPRAFAVPAELEPRTLNRLVRNLWAEVTQRVR